MSMKINNHIHTYFLIAPWIGGLDTSSIDNEEFSITDTTLASSFNISIFVITLLSIVPQFDVKHERPIISYLKTYY